MICTTVDFRHARIFHSCIQRNANQSSVFASRHISKVFTSNYFSTISDSYKTESGEELSTRKIKAALKEVISTEDKRKPMSDEALQKALAEKGFPIARRTISKYREQMGIPVARLRKES